MPITVEWDDERQKVIRYAFKGNWTWTEFNAAIQRGVELIQGIPYHVNMIIDLTEGNLVPENLLSRLMRSMETPPAEYDLAVIVTNSWFIENVLTIVRRINPRLAAKHPIVKSIKEARAILDAYDRRPRQSGPDSGQ